MGGRNSCRAETAANGEWRVANSEWFSGGSAPALPKKFFGASGDAPSSFVNLEKVGFLPDQKTSARRNRAFRFFRRIYSALGKSVANPMSLAPCPLLSEVSGMSRKKSNQHQILCTLALLHACALTRLHSYWLEPALSLVLKRTRPVMTNLPLSGNLWHGRKPEGQGGMCCG